MNPIKEIWGFLQARIDILNNTWPDLSIEGVIINQVKIKTYQTIQREIEKRYPDDVDKK